MRTIRVRALSGVAGVAIALAIAACGSSAPTSDQPSGAQTRTVTVTTPSTTATATATTSTTTTTTTAATTPACVAADLTPVFLGGNGAAGTNVVGFALKNTSSAACHTYGWVGAQFLSSSETAIVNPASRVTQDIVGTVPETHLTVQPGGEVSFRIAISDAANGGQGCEQASYLQIYAPDDTTAMRVAASVTACPQMTVTPLQAGTSAFSK